jgi:hypothetical protein
VEKCCIYCYFDYLAWMISISTYLLLFRSCVLRYFIYFYPIGYYKERTAPIRLLCSPPQPKCWPMALTEPVTLFCNEPGDPFLTHRSGSTIPHDILLNKITDISFMLYVFLVFLNCLQDKTLGLFSDNKLVVIIKRLIKQTIPKKTFRSMYYNFKTLHTITLLPSQCNLENLFVYSPFFFLHNMFRP